ncbi:stage II sporulation protein R [Thermosediminibacter oceani]|uniref:Stage II sporulation protein R n=1 Tax=Thermosediminibacter oceani (strain ATCC BAA-1034 / DSM 16646 / JW/IW-1228P) TaxID=555079 RepID=D9S134_THEOJ|nr:stage II sporulation protein R [Thermosediminibacter oceani]ADL08913.1 stage II sporulation protein R [Thermosediminibacter oceani DSM 16646]
MGLFRKTVIASTAIILLALFAAVVGGSGIAGGRLEGEKAVSGIDVEDLSSKIIRLHVVANSDSPEDQELKLRVRDAVIKALENDLSKVEDIDLSREYIKAHLKDIEEIARKEIKKSGRDHSVRVLFGRFPFPVKTYGFITLPAGEYEALRIIIGRGEGKNWWCVLFPPLCFVDITHAVAREEAKIKLSSTLTPEEMAAIDNTQNRKDEPATESTQDREKEPVIENKPTRKNIQNGEGKTKRIIIQNREEVTAIDNTQNLAEESPGDNNQNLDEKAAADDIQNPKHERVVVRFKVVEWFQAAWSRIQQNFNLAFKN